MAWTTRFTDRAKKELAKLDKPVAKRITSYLRRHVDEAADPRAVGEALQGSEVVKNLPAVARASPGVPSKARRAEQWGA